MEVKHQVNAWIDAQKDDIVKDTVRLIQKYSPREEATEDKPFGEATYQALLQWAEICKEHGFAPQIMDNCIGVADLGCGEPQIGILCHLDVVPIGPGWTMAPTEGIVKDGKIFGRGAIDDKGPAVSVLYAMKAIREAGITLKNPVRFIVGTDEECGSADIPHYKKYAKMPPMLFTPDGGYPVINSEKGMFRAVFERAYTENKDGVHIVFAKGGATVNAVPGLAECKIAGMDKAALEEKFFTLPGGVTASAQEACDGVAITFKGNSAHASTPNEGDNAVTAMLSYLSNLPIAGEEKEAVEGLCKAFPHGEANGASVNLRIEDQKSGMLTLAFSVFSMENGKVQGKCDIRFPVSTNGEIVGSTLSAALCQVGYTLVQGNASEPHETPEEGAFVQTLLRTYHDVTGEEAYCVAIGGGTYVHHEEGGVAFGPEVPGAEDHHMHGPDEFVYIDELLFNAKMFAQAIINLQEV